MDYKKYSLENLENWMHDCMSSGEATPQEIYDTIVEVVKENYYIYKDQVSKAYELLVFLNGSGQSFKDVLREKQRSEPSMPPLKYSTKTYDQMIAGGYEMTDDGFWVLQSKKNNDYVQGSDENGDGFMVEDKVIRWQLPVEVDGLTGDCFVTLPDDLLERAGLVEGDKVTWIDNGNGTFTLRKVTEPLGIDEC